MIKIVVVSIQITAIQDYVSPVIAAVRGAVSRTALMRWVTCQVTRVHNVTDAVHLLTWEWNLSEVQ